MIQHLLILALLWNMVQKFQKLLKKFGLAARTTGDGETVTAQLPASGQSVPGNSQVLLYLGDAASQETGQVPDFLGMTRQQASDAAGTIGLYVLVSGNTAVTTNVTVTAQDVLPGTLVNVGSTIKLVFTDTQAAD